MKFFKWVRPGDQLILEATLSDLKEEGSTVSVSGSVAGEKVVEGELLFAHLAGKSAGSEDDFVFTPELLSVLNV